MVFINALFFYGLAFIFRYFLGTLYITEVVLKAEIIQFVFELLLIMGGFSLLYSLLWRKFDPARGRMSSLFNAKILVFYLLAIVISLIDVLWNMYTAMFIAQIIIFIYATIACLGKYGQGNKKGFLGLYFIVILLNLFGWIINAIVGIFLNWNEVGVIVVNIINVIIFILFLFEVTRTTSPKHG
jgi:hypothetical protein